jgi:hypothetical protein
MFDCKACSAKDAEIARLWKMVTELTDRYTALTGTLPQVVEASEYRSVVQTEPEADERQQSEQNAADWQETELAQRELDIRHKGGEVRPDFPT